MDFHNHFRLSSHAVIFNLQNELLQLKATYGNKSWGLPGGSLEPGETIHEALIRECQEELGIKVEIVYLSGIYFHKTYNSHACIFRCNMQPNSHIQLSSEHSEYRYFKLEELTAIQRKRIEDCLNYDGKVKSAAF